MSGIKQLILILIFAASSVFIAAFINSRRQFYEGPPSNHFDGTCFFGDHPEHTFAGMIKWLWEMKTVDWPEWINDPIQPKPVAFIKDSNLKVTFINHATFLIQTDSLNILTDPIWSRRAGPFSWIGTARVRNPGIKMDDLPRIDIILISHDHFDHLDLPTLRELMDRFHPRILAGLGVGKLLLNENISNVAELDWWQDYTCPGSNLKFTFVPAQHSSGRFIMGDNRTLWGGFVIEGAGGPIYFAGDTGYDQFLDSIKSRFLNFRLTILPIGNYEKRWFMKSQHMNPEDAVMAHILLHSNHSIGMHFSTFLEHPEQAIDAHEKDLQYALKKYDLADSNFIVPKFGEGIMIGPR